MQLGPGRVELVEQPRKAIGSPSAMMPIGSSVARIDRSLHSSQSPITIGTAGTPWAAASWRRACPSMSRPVRPLKISGLTQPNRSSDSAIAPFCASPVDPPVERVGDDRRGVDVFEPEGMAFGQRPLPLGPWTIVYRTEPGPSFDIRT